MHTRKLLDEIKRLSQDLTTPSPDKRNNHRFPEILEYTDSDANDLMVPLWEEVTGKPKRKDSLEEYRYWLFQVILNLAQGVITKQWSIFAGDDHAYSKQGYMRAFGFTNKRQIKAILKFLEQTDRVKKLPGKVFEKGPRANLYWPVGEFKEVLAWFGLFTISVDSFNRPFVMMKDRTGPWVDFYWPHNHPDLVELQRINEFAASQSWACKSSIRMIFKHDPFEVGRLFTPFQNLPQRRYSIRINTQINDEPICEVDFNANHLRMFLAMNQTPVVGESDAYQPIAEEAGMKRQVVKNFLNVALNCTSEAQAYNAARANHSISHEESRRVVSAFHKVYRTVDLFEHQGRFGNLAQNIEGQILKQVMLEGVDQDVMVLPIHDAVAVAINNLDWTEQVMCRAWEEQVGAFYAGAKPTIKVEFPDLGDQFI
jgi:hypothetical protein